jgi:F0F1-type ATP synthase assembly protein I
MKEKIIKNLGNIGLLVLSAGIWIDVLFDIAPEGRPFSVLALIFIALGAVMVAIYIVMRIRAKKSAEAEEDSKGSGDKDEK